jgi:hypothetical protein
MGIDLKGDGDKLGVSTQSASFILEVRDTDGQQGLVLSYTDPGCRFFPSDVPAWTDDFVKLRNSKLSNMLNTDMAAMRRLNKFVMSGDRTYRYENPNFWGQHVCMDIVPISQEERW